MANPSSVAALHRLSDEIIQLIVENDNLEEIELRIDETTAIFERVKLELDEITANQVGSVLSLIGQKLTTNRNATNQMIHYKQCGIVILHWSKIVSHGVVWLIVL